IPTEEKWNLDVIFKNETNFEERLTYVENEVTNFLKFKGKMGGNADTLLNAIETLETITKHMEHIMLYALLHVSTDGSDPENQARYAKVTNVVTKINAQIAFVEPELMQLSNDKFTLFFQ